MTQATLESLKNQVSEKIESLQRKVEKKYGKRVQNLTIKYDLKTTRLGGQACYRPISGEHTLRFHPAALAEYKNEYIEGTVVHEFAHAVQSEFYDYRTKPHGNEWKSVMCFFGKNPKRCHSMNLVEAIKKHSSVTGIKAGRKVKRYTYKCNCQTHELTVIRHNRVVRGEQSYFCKKCKQTVVKA